MKIAIIWASDNSERYSYKIWKKFQNSSTKIFLVSERLSSIEWEKTYKNISEIKEFVDIYVFVVNSKVSYEIIRNNLDLISKSKLWFQKWSFDDDVIQFCKDNCLVYENESCMLVDY